VARILVADDTPATRAAIELILSSAGHDVMTVADGEAVLTALTSEAVDLAVLDIWMPKRSGLDVLKVLRQRHPTLPVIMVSGGGPGATLEQATALADVYRASKVLYKPFEDEELLDAVAALVG
jgi:CheY-like chemotaxis protein